jgi:hypothetical protein
MQEQQRIAFELLYRNADDIAGAKQSGVGMADRAFGLERAIAQPLIGEGESLTAMVVLAIVHPHVAAIGIHRDMFGHAVRHSRQPLGQVERGIRVVADSQEQNLSIEIVNAANRAPWNVWRQRERIRRHEASAAPQRREREGMGASINPWHSPKRIGDDSEIG